jgi:hypothetical protein
LGQCDLSEEKDQQQQQQQQPWKLFIRLKSVVPEKCIVYLIGGQM